MKTKKLFLGLLCLSALVLGACSGGKSSSAAGSSNSSDSGSSSSSSSSSHEHQWDEHGVCPTDGVYGGATVDVGGQWNVGATQTGKVYYGRAKLAPATNYVLASNPLDPKIDETKMKAWWKTSTGWEDISLDAPLLLSASSTDSYAYFHMEFTEALSNVSLWLEDMAALHTHSYDDYGLCENCPYGEAVGYRGETFYNDTNGTLLANGRDYYECRFFYTNSTIKFFETDIRKESQIATLKIAYRKNSNWEVIYNGPANSNCYLANLQDIEGSFVYLRYDWDFEGEPTSNYFRCSDLAAHQFYDVTHTYRGYYVNDLGVGNEEQIQKQYVVDAGSYKQVYFGYNDSVTEGKCYKPLAVGFGVNPQFSAYQLNPSTHLPEALSKKPDGSYEVLRDSEIVFILTTTVSENIVGSDSYLIGIDYIGMHSPDEVGYCVNHPEVWVGEEDVWHDGGGITGVHFDAGQTRYYRASIPAEGHFRITKNAYINWGEVRVFYRVGLGDYEEILDSDEDPYSGFTTEFHSDYDQYAYIVVCPEHETNSVTLTLELIDHKTLGFIDCGYCTWHEYDFVWAGDHTLTVGDSNWTTVTIEKDVHTFVRFAGNKDDHACLYFKDSTWPAGMVVSMYAFIEDSGWEEVDEPWQFEYLLPEAIPVSSLDGGLIYYVIDFTYENPGTASFNLRIGLEA